MPRLTITTTPQKVCSGVAQRRKKTADEEWATRSFVICKPAGGAGGTVLLQAGSTVTAPDMSDAARFDFSSMALTYECEPGVSLWAATSSGTVALDVLQGGER